MSGRSRIVVGVLLLFSVLLIVLASWPRVHMALQRKGWAAASVIAFGDSLTRGFGAAGGEDYPAQLSKLTGLPILNAGANGDTTASALARLERDVLAHHPRLVLVGLGTNDHLRNVPLAVTAKNLRAIVRRIHSNGAEVVLLGFRFSNGEGEAMYRRIAEEERCSLVPDVLHDAMSDQRLRSDDIHPNGAGYAKMAERIRAYVVVR